MPRKPRNYYLSNFNHIMTQGDEKKFIFKEEKNKKKYIYLLKHNAFRNDVEIISYCIMDNHAHILLYCPSIERISKMMQQTNTSFGLYYNTKRKKVGHVFRDRFRTESINSKLHLIHCIKYIHFNPVKAGICQKCEDYAYSSFKEFYKIKNHLLKICDISPKDLNSILLESYTSKQYIDIEDEEKALDMLMERMNHQDLNLEDSKEVAEVYCQLKEECRIPDTEIARILNFHRNKLIRILKKEGKK